MTIIQMSLSAALLIIIATIIRTATLHKIPKTTFLILWLIILVKLFIPKTIPVNLSVNLNPISSWIEVTDAISTGHKNFILMQPVYNGIYEATQAETGFEMSPLFVIWITGVLLTAAFIIGSHLYYRKYYTISMPIKNEFIEQWAKENQLSFRKIQIGICPAVNEALTYGLFRPVILLPQSTDWDNHTRMKYILTHEITHIRRCDILWKWLLVLAVCLHWFNPAVWLMYMLANRDLEITCDETVLKKLGLIERKDYALTLIEVAENSICSMPISNSFSNNSVKERIESIMKMKKNSKFTVMISVVTVTILSTTAFVSAADNNNNAAYTKPIQTVNLEITQRSDKQPLGVTYYNPGEENPYYDIHSNTNTVYIVHLEQTAEELGMNEREYLDYLNKQADILIGDLNLKPSLIIVDHDRSIASIYVGEVELKGDELENVKIEEGNLTRMEVTRVLDVPYGYEGEVYLYKQVN